MERSKGMRYFTLIALQNRFIESLLVMVTLFNWSLGDAAMLQIYSSHTGFLLSKGKEKKQLTICNFLLRRPKVSHPIFLVEEGILQS